MYVDFHDLSPVKAAGPGPSKFMTQHRKRGTSFCLFTLVLSLFPPLLVLPHSFLMVKDSDQQALQTIRPRVFSAFLAIRMWSGSRERLGTLLVPGGSFCLLFMFLVVRF